MATHSSVLAWRIPGTGEPGGLPSMGSQSRTQLKWLSSLAGVIYLILPCINHIKFWKCLWHTKPRGGCVVKQRSACWCQLSSRSSFTVLIFPGPNPTCCPERCFSVAPSLENMQCLTVRAAAMKLVLDRDNWREVRMLRQHTGPTSRKLDSDVKNDKSTLLWMSAAALCHPSFWQVALVVGLSHQTCWIRNSNGDPAICVLGSPGDYHSCSSLRTTAFMPLSVIHAQNFWQWLLTLVYFHTSHKAWVKCLQVRNCRAGEANQRAKHSLVAQMIKNLPGMRKTWVWSLGQKDPLEKETATQSSIRA